MSEDFLWGSQGPGLEFAERLHLLAELVVGNDPRAGAALAHMVGVGAVRDVHVLQRDWFGAPALR